MFYIIIIIFIIAGAWFKLNKSRLIGKIGEGFVASKLRQLNKDHYKLLNDVLLPSPGNSPTTQIDHIIVSNYGIFCIETKYYKGWIFGGVNQKYWTQVIYRYKKKFYNPLRQNYVHIKAIEQLVKPLYPNIPIISFVAFPIADKLKISGTDSVGYARDVVAKIKNFNQLIISDNDCNNICEIISKANIQNKKDRKLHNENVRSLNRESRP